MFYRLRGHEVEEVFTVQEWGRWFQTAERHVAQTTLPMDDDGTTAWVSTIFLGLDHGYTMNGPPVVFETMVFIQVPEGRRHSQEADFDDECETFNRYATWDEAAAGHERIVATVTAAIAKLRDQARQATASLAGASAEKQRSLLDILRGDE